MHPFDTWVQEALLPFAHTALSAGHDEIYISWRAPRPWQATAAVPSWWVLSATHASQPVARGAPCPDDLAITAHQRLVMARLAPAFWNGLDAQMHAFSSPLHDQDWQFDLRVAPWHDTPVTLEASPNGPGASTLDMPFGRHSDWKGAYATIAATRHDNLVIHRAEMEHKGFFGPFPHTGP